MQEFPGRNIKEAGDLAQRRACKVLTVDRSSVRYKSVRPDGCDLREAIRKVASERWQFGYRRIHIMLQRKGIVMNQKKLRRLYCDERLQVRRRGGRKRALGTRRQMALPTSPNECWSLDFVSDAYTDGRRFRILAVVDNFTRECIGLAADTSVSGARIVRELDAIIARRGKPRTVVSDNGSCYRSYAFENACAELDVKHNRTRPYTLKTNGKAERFIKTALEEWAYARAYPNSDHHAKDLPKWTHDYNWHRPHGGIGSIAPIQRIRLNGNNLLIKHI